ncbi:TPA: type-F conjugative transfer system pilin assembly protein TrbC [Aeromonas salmonicida]|uniref:type-F conjugative transfer system pilin assembly protein TrbC n=1 Tax=Aeromonas salmonicida TaxID=645 RepID=UPI000451B323|nr:type-F conjugative transfer system pilin assembly protein TrbC [Aeromonas salmonicida]ELI6439845.1 type-F conjugative transfer system pilin assembly protein TrbC [Aeromonas salmonicida subsp. salmonicida]ASI21519.1 type-F conjugative transfer system pilin assembly protein TrbC [Aeromonas salmonicida]ASI25811.1 type-F conjugative transfer system pilin assembly protein TrbC [Aeromonas salmonicida]ASI29911.1 type-F conjugative transfer system pilin assembly protein TrbC [Aeromonas salmonicida]
MTRPLIFTLLGMLICPAYAADPAQTDLAHAQQFIDGLIANPPGNAHQQAASELGQQSSGQMNNTDSQWAQSLARQQQAAAGAKPVPQALYFVSFSIPQTGLKRLILDADRFGIPATLRGMINNDMRQTANAVLQLVNEDQRGGVQIDPQAFRRYGINAVPALVVTCGETYDHIAGNLALQQALTKVAESGECADTAKAILAAHP